MERTRELLREASTTSQQAAAASAQQGDNGEAILKYDVVYSGTSLIRTEESVLIRGGVLISGVVKCKAHKRGIWATKSVKIL